MTNTFLRDDATFVAVAGSLASSGTFTLTASATSTTVTDAACTGTSKIFFSPSTADGANDMATTYAVPGTGSFVVHHASNSTVDRSFIYIIL